VKYNNQKYCETYFGDNKLTRLEATVFQSFLTDIKPQAPFAARVFLCNMLKRFNMYHLLSFYYLSHLKF